MKRILFSLCLTVAGLSVPAYGQSDEPVLDVMEQMPSFPGGQQALFRYIAANITYPQEALEQGLEGRPVCKFVVNRDSTISDVELVRSCGTKSLDDEALRVISEMPKWNPGMQNGQAVRARYTLPVPFRITPAMSANLGQIFGTDVDSMPQFPGGNRGLAEYLQRFVMWPAIAKANNIKGTATCAFVVNKLGELTDLQVQSSAGDPSLDKEALRVVRSMPRWEPGIKDGQPVRVRTTVKIPVPFEMADIMEIDSTVFVVVETMPTFPGGQQALFNYLSKNVHYPEDAKRLHKEGRVICQFVVDIDGRITDVKVLQSGGFPSLDEEAVRVVKNMPRWLPGKQKGKPVRVQYRLPINFRFPD